jgi:hypothetical protein
MRKLYYLILLMLSGAMAMAQDSTSTKKLPFEIGADLMSRYVWRGQCIDKSPNIQPYFTYAPKFGLKIGAWGSYNFNGDYAEVDLYASYSLAGVSATFTDYFVMDESKSNNHFFDYRNASTAHLLEASLGYEGPQKFPIRITAATMLYGADKIPDVITVDTVLSDTSYTYRNAFSTYFEVAYTIKNISLFAGITPSRGFYGDKFGLVNAGISAKKEIPLSKNYSIAVQAALITNPQKQNIFLVFGLGF